MNSSDSQVFGCGDRLSQRARPVFFAASLLNSLARGASVRISRNANSDYVFCHKHRSPLVNLRKDFFTANKKIGRIGFVFRSLRYTSASQPATEASADFAVRFGLKDHVVGVAQLG